MYILNLLERRSGCVFWYRVGDSGMLCYDTRIYNKIILNYNKIKIVFLQDKEVPVVIPKNEH